MKAAAGEAVAQNPMSIFLITCSKQIYLSVNAEAAHMYAGVRIYGLREGHHITTPSAQLG